jgi:hypothetical protein
VFRCQTFRSGLSFNSELEERLAAQWARYRYEDFLELDGELQSAHVAAFRCEKQMEAAVQHKQYRKQKAANKQRV